MALRYKYEIGDEVLFNGTSGIVIMRNLFDLNTFSGTTTERWYDIQLKYVIAHVREDALTYPLRGCFTLGDKVIQVSSG